MTDAVIKTNESPTGTTNLGAVTFLDGADQIKIPKQVSVDADGVPIDAATESTLSDANAKLDALDGVTNKTIGTQITTSDIGIVTNTVMHGLSTGGGGGYVDVKVTPSGAVVTDTGLDPLTDDQLRASPIPSRLSDGTAFYDARDVRALTTTDTVVTHDYGVAVGLGEVSGVGFAALQGYNQATSTTNEPIWAQSGAAYPSPTSAQTLTISSSSALDTSAGTGARTVLVTYIRFSDMVEVVAPFTLNGQTGVTITTDGYAINGIRVLTAGTGGSNAGVIYVGYGAVTLGVPASILSTVVIGKNKAQQAIYTVPATKLFSLMTFRFITSTLTYIQLRTRSTPTSVQVVEFDLPLNGTASFNSVTPSNFAAGTQLQIWAQTAASAGAAGCILSGWLRSV
jgi:hypothetical protein